MNFDSLARIAREETRRALDELPPEIRREAEKVPIFFEQVPVEPDLDPDLLGLFDPGPEGSTPRIRLWLVNLRDYADGDIVRFREEVRVTLLHEIGHLLGWEEADLEERGLG